MANKGFENLFYKYLKFFYSFGGINKFFKQIFWFFKIIFLFHFAAICEQIKLFKINLAIKKNQNS